MKRNIEKEIKALENIIELLNRCLRIHLKSKNKIYITTTLRDIQVCKRELKKLEAARQVEMQAEKEYQNNAVQ